MIKPARSNKSTRLKVIILSLVIIASLGSCFFIVNLGVLLPVMMIGVSVLVGVQILFIKNPKGIIWTIVIYSFTFGVFGREIGGFPFGVFQEGILLLGWLTLIFTANRYDWTILRKNDLVILMIIWFVISVLEVGNPAGASVMGWMQEIRTAALYPVLLVPMAFLLIKKNKDLNIFLIIIICFSVLATINGLHQLYVHPWPGEQRFLDDGGAETHILFGQLRVFSFYPDAGQFGASQAAIALTTLILAAGPFKLWIRILLLIAALIQFDGMLISGTRGALFALIAGAFIAIALTKNIKAMIIGGAITLGFLFILKYTYIGNGSYQMVRLRSALDPDEASFNLRIINQRILKDYLSSRPFGGGLGVLGAWGIEYNRDKFLSTVAPDSYWVKVWAMYGIVGFIIWFGFMMYILGKCCGIVWKIEDKELKIKILALTAGFAGILVCSYGNEVINNPPSSFVTYISWVFIFITPRLEEELKQKQIQIQS